MHAFRYDFAVAFNGHALADEAARFEQTGHGEKFRQLLLFAVDGQIHWVILLQSPDHSAGQCALNGLANEVQFAMKEMVGAGNDHHR